MYDVSETPLQNGDSGEHVRQLQERLAAVGLFHDYCDGTFGETTEQAVRELQRLFAREETGRFEATEAADLITLEGGPGEPAPAAGWVWDGEKWTEDQPGRRDLASDGAGAGAAGQVSEDGQWQWDGERWQPKLA